MRKRAQSSIEFLAVTGIGLLLIVGVAGFYLSYSKSNEDQTKIQQVTSIGRTIINEANGVYALGKNSWTTVEVNMPDSITDAYVVEGNALVFDIGTLGGSVSQPIFTSTPITGCVGCTVGQKSFVHNASLQMHPSKTAFRITSLGDRVQIQAIS